MSGGLAPTDLGTESLSADELVVHVESSIQLAEIHRSKLSPPDALEDAASVLKLPGFSGLSTRHLLNNLCGVPLGGSHTRYLEVTRCICSNLDMCMPNSIRKRSPHRLLRL